MKDTQSVTEGQYRNLVVQYDPIVLLRLCNRLSAKLVKERKTIIAGDWPSIEGGFTLKKAFHITQHKIALLAMITLQNYRYSHGKTPSRKEFIALVNNVSTIRNPIDDNKPADPREAIFGMMIRLVYQQFPYQESIFNVLPRHLLLYPYSRVRSPLLKLDSEAHRYFGLSIMEYMTIGLAFHAASLEHAAFPLSFIENTPVESIKKHLTRTKIERFLSRTAVDFDTFRGLCMQEIKAFPDGGTYRFNPLFDRPIIKGKDGRFCVPVPVLVTQAITKGLYYDFLDIFSTETGNPFSEWFGHAFEYYGGLLLKYSFGKRNVYPEPTYGKAHQGGPDWTVVQGNSAIVFEFRSGRLNKKAKTYANYSDVATLVRRNVIEPLAKFPGKIGDIKAGLTGIPSDIGMEFFPCVVTYEPLYSTQLFNDIIQREMKREGIASFDHELMSIEDLEWLLSWSTHESPVDFLRAKRANPEWKVMGVRELVGVKAREKGISKIRNPLLDRVFDKFWRQTVPELSERRHS